MRLIQNKIVTTRDTKKFWRERQMDWKSGYFDTHNHPHRDFWINILKRKGWRFDNVMEVGCGAGANLYRISKEWPDALIGGVDINEDAIKTARKMFPIRTFLTVMDATDLYLTSNSVDLVMTDACLMYLGSKAAQKALSEIKRIGSRYFLFVEPHIVNPLLGFLVWRREGIFAHNYKKLLKKLGFEEVEFYKIPKGGWGDTGWEKIGYIILAKKT